MKKNRILIISIVLSISVGGEEECVIVEPKDHCNFHSKYFSCVILPV